MKRLAGGLPWAPASLPGSAAVSASFSRALLCDLRADMTDEQFDRTLGAAIDEIYTASTRKAV